MASAGGADECNNVSVMVIQSWRRSPACRGSEPALLGLSSVRLKPIPDQLRFSAVTTLHRLDGSAQISARMAKIRKRAANFALDRPANFALEWDPSRGGCALGIRLVAGDVGLQQDYEAGIGNGGVQRGR
jgi:hypothetical protein